MYVNILDQINCPKWGDNVLDHAIAMPKLDRQHYFGTFTVCRALHRHSIEEFWLTHKF